MVFFSEAGGSERAMRYTLTVTFLVLVFSFPLQMLAIYVLVQKLSSFMKDTQTSWHPSLQDYLSTSQQLRAEPGHSLLALFCTHLQMQSLNC